MGKSSRRSSREYAVGGGAYFGVFYFGTGQRLWHTRYSWHLDGDYCTGQFLFCYALFSKWLKWPSTLLISYVAFALTALVLDAIPLTIWEIYGLALVVITITLYYFPRPSVGQTAPSRVKPPKYDLLFRMLVATLFVLTITGLAAILGPSWSGVLTPFPILTSILAIFNHYLQGSTAAITVLRGIMIGLVGFTTFLFLQAFLLHEFSVVVAFLIALVVNAVINLVSSRVWG